MRYIIYDVERKKQREEIKREREKDEKNIQQDVNNREYIRNKIKAHMIYGISQEDAVDLVMQEEKEIMDQFDYLTKNGIDIRQCLINWTNGIKKQLEKKVHDDNEEER